MNETNNASNGAVVGSLTNDEKQLLTNEIESTVKRYKVGFIFACISIVIVIGLIIAPAMYVAIRKQQKKLKLAQGGELKVYEVKGSLSRKNVATKGKLYAYLIDGRMIGGEVLNQSDKSGLETHLGETVTFQYIPSLSKNRSYTDPNGHGYNFITKTSI